MSWLVAVELRGESLVSPGNGSAGVDGLLVWLDTGAFFIENRGFSDCRHVDLVADQPFRQ